MSETTTTRDGTAIIEAMRGNLSPQAIALMIAKLQTSGGRTDAGRSADLELQWLSMLLIGEIGSNELSRLFDEVGV